MEKFAGNTLLTQTEAEKFNSEIYRCIKEAEERGEIWEVQYKPLILENRQLVYTALILYKKKGGGA